MVPDQPDHRLTNFEYYAQLLGQARRRVTKAELEVIQNDPELIALVERIKATPPNPAAIRPATGSLAEALQNSPEDLDFDLESWTRQWAAIEAEIKAIDRANDIAEGRG
jgi:hypothetical protein